MLIKKGYLYTRKGRRLKKVLNLKTFFGTVLSLSLIIGLTYVILTTLYVATLNAVLWIWRIGAHFAVMSGGVI